jgi:hypothetical protein
MMGPKSGLDVDMDMDEKMDWDHIMASIGQTFEGLKVPVPEEMEADLKERYEEADSILKEFADIRSLRPKYERELKGVEEALSRARQTLDKCEKRTALLTDKVTKKRAKLSEAQTAVDSALEVWDMFGFRLDLQPSEPGTGTGKERERDADKSPIQGLLSLKFSKIDPKNPDKLFVVNISLENNRVKILGMEPTGLLSDLRDIEAKANAMEKKREEENEEGFNFRYLAVLIRKSLRQSLATI